MARRSGLGRGLDALIPAGAEPEPAAGSALAELPVSDIHPNPYQPRRTFDDEALEALASSITELGVLQPILVRRGPQGYELVAGERRFRAAQLAGLATVPAIVRDLADQTSLEQALVENVQREDLLPLEEAAAYQQLIDEFDLTQDEVATRVGRSRSAVANSLRLLGLPTAVQRLLQERRLSAGHARAVLGLDDPEAQIVLAETAARNGWSVREVESKVRALLAEPAPSPERRPKLDRPAGVLEVERLLADQLATRVGVTMTAAGRGRIVIDFAGLEDLDRIFQAMGGRPEDDDRGR